MARLGIVRKVAAAFAVGLTAVALSACSFSTSTGKSVKEADVESQISAQLAAKIGEKPKSVTCPGDLKAKQGTTMRCSLVDKTDKKYGLTVTVTSVEGNTVNFDIKVDDEPTP